MISNIGNYFQIFALLFSILTIITIINKFSLNNLFISQRLPFIFFSLSSLFILLAFLLLVYGFIISDFSIQNVFLNSSTLKPLTFKIAASWASHESSILLWLCLLQVIGFIYITLLNYYLGKESYNTLFTAKINQTSIQHIDHENFKPLKGYDTSSSNQNNIFYHLIKSTDGNKISLIILSLIQIIFGSFIYFHSNPFSSLSFHPSQGLGLNPMLQDVALVIHPPILYLGYISYIVPFTSACTILFCPKATLIHLKLIKIFANLGILFLTLGIALGSWWAYRELGWSGFWFFDPIENISLLPWLSGIVLYHTVKVTIYSKRMKNWTIYLSIITFLIILFNIFLTRSGLITSIHSFALSQKQAIYLLAIFTVIAIPSLILIILKHKNYTYHNNILVTTQIIFQEKIALIGWTCFLIALVILLYATIYPIAYSILYQESITIGERFFINNFIIFIIPTILSTAIAQFNNIYKYNLLTFILTLIIIIISSKKISYGFISGSITVFSLFLILQTCFSFLIKRRKGEEEVNISMILGHLGFGLLALTITLNSLLQKEIEFIGKIGDKVTTEDFEITLQDIRFSVAQNYYRQIAEFWVQDKQNNLTILKPENRLYIVEKQLSQESNIYSYLTYDLYAVLNRIDDKTIHAKIYYKPLMSFMWISILFIAGGFVTSLLNNFSLKKLKSIGMVNN